MHHSGFLTRRPLQVCPPKRIFISILALISIVLIKMYPYRLLHLGDMEKMPETTELSRLWAIAKPSAVTESEIRRKILWKLDRLATFVSSRKKHLEMGQTCRGGDDFGEFSLNLCGKFMFGTKYTCVFNATKNLWK